MRTRSMNSTTKSCSTYLSQKRPQFLHTVSRMLCPLVLSPAPEYCVHSVLTGCRHSMQMGIFEVTVSVPDEVDLARLPSHLGRSFFEYGPIGAISAPICAAQTVLSRHQSPKLGSFGRVDSWGDLYSGAAIVPIVPSTANEAPGRGCGRMPRSQGVGISTQLDFLTPQTCWES